MRKLHQNCDGRAVEPLNCCFVSLAFLVGREAWGWHSFSDPRLAGVSCVVCTTSDLPQLF